MQLSALPIIGMRQYNLVPTHLRNTAPALDPTDERKVETGQGELLGHRQPKGPATREGFPLWLGKTQLPSARSSRFIVTGSWPEFRQRFAQPCWHVFGISDWVETDLIGEELNE